MPERCVRRAKLEAYFLAAGFTKLEVPVETREVWCTVVFVDENIDFDVNYFNPAADSMIRAMTGVGIREFYRLSVHYDASGTLRFTASRGDSIG